MKRIILAAMAAASAAALSIAIAASPETAPAGGKIVNDGAFHWHIKVPEGFVSEQAPNLPNFGAVPLLIHSPGYAYAGEKQMPDPKPGEVACYTFSNEEERDSTQEKLNAEAEGAVKEGNDELATLGLPDDLKAASFYETHKANDQVGLVQLTPELPLDKLDKTKTVMKFDGGVAFRSPQWRLDLICVAAFDRNAGAPAEHAAMKALVEILRSFEPVSAD